MAERGKTLGFHNHLFYRARRGKKICAPRRAASVHLQMRTVYAINFIMISAQGKPARVVLLLAFIFVFASPAFVSAAQQRVKVVASIPPLADFARQVGGDKVDVALLLPPGASPHTFEPSPRVMQEIASARIFIKIGAGLEFWADKLIAAANRNILLVDCSEGVDLIRDAAHDHGGLHGADPHYWLDPVICLKVVTRIENALIAADPGNAALYRKNAAAYRERLVALDREIAASIKTFRTMEYITFHSAWNYFSRRYGLKVAGVIEESPGKEPSPRHIGAILRALKKMKTKVVFAEPQFSPKIAEAIAREGGGRVLFLDPEGGLKGRETYIDLIRYNVSMMEKAMK